MPEMVKPGIIPVKKYQAVCGNCGCVFNVSEEERKWQTDYDGDNAYYPCLTCRKNVFELKLILPDGRVST